MAKITGKEIGVPGGVRSTSNGRQTTYEVEPLELNYDLQFPHSIPVYDALRSQDGHVGSVLSAIMLPLISAHWDLTGDGVRPEVLSFVRQELGIPAPGESLARRRRHGINWSEHVAQAAEAMLWAGFSPFEQVYSVAPAEDHEQDLGLEHIIHLRKVAQRLPRTITKIELDADGGLKALHQTSADPLAGDNVIPVERLVLYVNRREGADWSGRSILRQAYKHWLIKDVLLRLDAQAAERNSMGIPVVYYNDESQKDMAMQAVQNFRAGATAGLALPMTCKVELLGVSGSTVDLIPRIQYHDQEIARSALAMFLDLGHDNGARSLGEVHLSVFMSSVQAFADQIAATATEHIVRDLVELNFGANEPYPAITAGNLSADQGIITSTSLKEMVDCGVIIPDDDLEAFMRSKSGLPAANPASTRQAPAQQATGPVQVQALPTEDGATLSKGLHDMEISEVLERVLEIRNRGKHVQ